MPWFGAEPTMDDLLFWNVVQIPPSHLISLWPRPNSPRVDARFRLRHMINDVIHPSPSKFYVNPDTNDGIGPGFPPRWENWGWLDLAVVVEGHLQGTTGVDPDGWSLTMDIMEFDSLPVDGRRGVRQWVQIDSPGGEWFRKTVEFPQPDLSLAYRVMPTEVMLQLFGGITTQSAGWSHDTRTQDIYWRPVSDCYPFPPPGGEGFANFNGVDSWIELSQFVPPMSEPWMYKADLFVRGTRNIGVMVSTISVSSFTGYGSGRGHWSSTNGLLTPDIPFNQWFNWRMERDWSIPFGNRFRVWVDDVQVGNWTGANFQLNFNALGGNRPLAPPLDFGDFDMRNLLVQDTNPASPRTLLDMPLTENTCDLSPFQNHGIPHNMILPACPP